MNERDFRAHWRRLLTRHRRGVVAGVAVLAAGMLAVLLRPGPNQHAHGQWVPVVSQAQTYELTAEGRVAPARLVEIPSAAGGTLSEVKVAFGDRVEQGQALVRIASAELDAQLRTAEAANLRGQLQDNGVLAGEEPGEVLSARRRLLSAQGVLQSAESRAADSEVLYAKGFVSRQDRDAAVLEAANAADQLAVAKEDLRAASLKYAPQQLRALRLDATNRAVELEQLRQRRALLQVVAPLSGVVLPPAARENAVAPARRELVLGARVAAGDTVLAIGDMSSLLVQATCSEADLAWLDVGMPAQVTVAALTDRVLEGRVARLGTAARVLQNHSGSNGPEFDCEFALQAGSDVLSEKDRSRLRIGGSAKVHVAHAASARQASVPVAAVSWSPDGRAQILWRASANEAGQERSVRVSRAGVADVQLYDVLEGEVWIPADPNALPQPSFLSRILGVDL